MAVPNRSLGIAGVIVGAYALLPLPYGELVAAVGALVIGIILLLR